MVRGEVEEVGGAMGEDGGEVEKWGKRMTIGVSQGFKMVSPSPAWPVASPALHRPAYPAAAPASPWP